MPANPPTISAIVISYNTRGMTLRCLRMLEEEMAGIDAEIWVVDNGSSDGSAAAIAEQFPDIRLIANAGNRGFGAANNQAMIQARGAYLLLLNSDAFLQTGALRAMLDALDR